MRASEAEQESLRRLIVELGDRSVNLDGQRAEQEEALAGSEVQLADLRRELLAAESGLSGLREEHERLKDDRMGWEVRKAEVDRDLVNLEEACWQELKKTVQEVKAEAAAAETFMGWFSHGGLTPPEGLTGEGARSQRHDLTASRLRGRGPPGSAHSLASRTEGRRGRGGPRVLTEQLSLFGGSKPTVTLSGPGDPLGGRRHSALAIPAPKRRACPGELPREVEMLSVDGRTESASSRASCEPSRLQLRALRCLPHRLRGGELLHLERLQVRAPGRRPLEAARAYVFGLGSGRSGASSTARTFRASPSGVSGFCR